MCGHLCSPNIFFQYGACCLYLLSEAKAIVMKEIKEKKKETLEKKV